MGVYFLLYIEDIDNKSDGKVNLFLSDEAAQSAMEAAYARTLQTLRLCTDGRSGDCYCQCRESFAIIANGENFYSWSIGQRKFAGAFQAPESQPAQSHPPPGRAALRLRQVYMLDPLL